MGLDLHGRATGGLDEGFHGVDVLANAVRLRLPVDIHENVVGVVVGEAPRASQNARPRTTRSGVS